jgi:hypothetical protein
MVKIDVELKRFIDCEMQICTQASDEMQKESFDVGALDIFFRKFIKNQ